MNEDRLIELIKKEIQKYYSFEEKIDTVCVLGADSIIREEVEKRFSVSEKSDVVVVTELDVNELVSLGQGAYITPKSEKLLLSLLEGKTIFLIEEGLKWRNFEKVPSKLKEQYLEYEGFLVEYGIKIVKRMEIIDELENKKQYYTGNVLDIKQLKANIKDKKIIISSKTKVTELASEYAQVNDIKIIKR